MSSPGWSSARTKWFSGDRKRPLNSDCPSLESSRREYIEAGS